MCIRDRSNADAIALYNEAMTQLCIEKKVPVLVCAGNHDGAARLASCGALLEKAGLYIAGSVRDGLKTVPVSYTHLHVATDDGTFGVAGFCTNLLADELSKDKPDVILACGPLVFFRTLARVIGDVPAFVLSLIHI